MVFIIYYIAKWKPSLNFLNRVSFSDEKMEVWRVNEAVGFGLREMLEYLLNSVVSGDLVSRILCEIDVILESKYLSKVISAVELDVDRVLKV